MVSTIHWVLVGLIWIAVFTSVGLWARFFTRRLKNQAPAELVPLHHQRRPFWTPADFLVMFGLLLVGLFVLNDVFATQGWIEPRAANGERSMKSLIVSLAINSLAGIIAGSITLGWLCFCYPGAIRELGLWPTWSQIALGLRASLWLLPPIGLISLMVSLLVPYEHPVLDTLAASPTTVVFVAMFIGTAIVAPLVEEFMFRVLLQGGLQRLADGAYDGSAVDDEMDSAPNTECDEDAIDVRYQVAPRDEINLIADAYRPPREQLVEITVESAQATGHWAPKSYWPIVVTSVLFALMHSGQGAAPIPLFFLSIGLGYLYRQTGRITAPLVVHIVLNATTMMVEFTRIAAGIGS